MDELFELKDARMKLGLTQKELAQRANVSQSLIAKIESGKLDPSYTIAKRLFETLTVLNKGKELSAKDIMCRKIISVSPSERLKACILLMRKNNISQLPVKRKEKTIGFISETVILDKLLEGEKESVAEDVMGPCPPIMPLDTSQGIIAHLLKHFPLILIEEKGETVGLITKADLLNAVYK